MWIRSNHVTRAATARELMGAELGGHDRQGVMLLVRLLLAVNRQRVLLHDGGIRSCFKDRRVGGTSRRGRLQR